MVDSLFCNHGWGPGKGDQGKNKIKIEEGGGEGEEGGGGRRDRRRRRERNRRIIKPTLSTFSGKTLSRMATMSRSLKKWHMFNQSPPCCKRAEAQMEGPALAWTPERKGHRANRSQPMKHRAYE